MPDDEADAFSIPEFCKRHRISTSFYFKEKAAGRGPREMEVGARRLISKEAAAGLRKAGGGRLIYGVAKKNRPA